MPACSTSRSASAGLKCWRFAASKLVDDLVQFLVAAGGDARAVARPTTSCRAGGRRSCASGCTAARYSATSIWRPEAGPELGEGGRAGANQRAPRDRGHERHVRRSPRPGPGVNDRALRVGGAAGSQVAPLYPGRRRAPGGRRPVGTARGLRDRRVDSVVHDRHPRNLRRGATGCASSLSAGFGTICHCIRISSVRLV